MVKMGLQLKADLENLTNLRPVGEDFRWYLRLKCLYCHGETEEFQYLSLVENAPLARGRGHASLVLKCKICHRESSVDIIRDSIQPYNSDDSGKFKTVVIFDCRGVEPIDFSPRTGFAGEVVNSGTPFNNISFTDGEDGWYEYDERARCPVGVCNLVHKFVTIE